jgi:hypothetical protein
VFRIDPSGGAGYGVGMRPLACWDHGFESRRGNGCLSLVSVVCCETEVSAKSLSLVQRSPTDCGASLRVIQKPQERGTLDPRWAAVTQKNVKEDHLLSVKVGSASKCETLAPSPSIALK